MAEVDSVLTSGEVQQLLEAHGRALSDLSAAPLDALVTGAQQDGRLYGLPGGSGYVSFPLARPLFVYLMFGSRGSVGLTGAASEVDDHMVAGAAEDTLSTCSVRCVGALPSVCMRSGV